MAKTLFVDTNVFLSLYAFSDDDIEQFRRLFVLAQEGEIDFILPQQVIDEFWRNRESRILESISPLQKSMLVKIPAPIRDLEESLAFMAAQKNADLLRENLVKVFLQKASSKSLKADELVAEIFARSTIVKVTDEILESARHRVTLGNPPGKSGSFGDAINWECILTRVGLFDNLYFVSRDKDYASTLHAGQFNEFLTRELDSNQISTVFYFSSLSSFMKSQFPDVEIDAFTEASQAIQQLEGSASFAATHAAIFGLSNCSNFSTKQIQRIIAAAELNSQVSMIIADDDLQKFYKTILDRYGSVLGKHWLGRLEALLRKTDTIRLNDMNDVPFEF